MQLSSITIYPVKSCAGVSLETVELDRFGPAGDRRWLVVDPAGRFLSQRELPAMALIHVEVLAGGIRLRCHGDHVDVRVPEPDRPVLSVRVWEDTVAVQNAGEDAARWLSQHLGVECALVYMPDSTHRRVDGAYAQDGETVGFADGFPLLLLSQASLDDLNSRLDTPVPMNRFRPNLVVTGCEPFAEDSWKCIRIGGIDFRVAKPCSRCVIPSIDQQTGQRDKQINRVLASYRRILGEVRFGQNLLYPSLGTVNVGDPVEVVA
jgi:MOSC domain-containing protein